jgi:hypothetical protein
MWLHGGVYDEWAQFLGRWATGDERGMASLPPVHPQDLPADTIDRLVRRIVDALSTRLQSWADTVAPELSRAQDDFSAGRALAQARNGLRSIRRLAQHPSLPEPLHIRLLELVDGQVVSFQDSLEDAVTRAATSVNDRAEVEARRRALRENPLTAVLTTTFDLAPATTPSHGTGRVGEGPAPVGERGDDWFVDPTRTPRRRVVIDLPPTDDRPR